MSTDIGVGKEGEFVKMTKMEWSGWERDRAGAGAASASMDSAFPTSLPNDDYCKYEVGTIHQWHSIGRSYHHGEKSSKNGQIDSEEIQWAAATPTTTTMAVSVLEPRGRNDKEKDSPNL
jgi:hypothetical protein